MSRARSARKRALFLGLVLAGEALLLTLGAWQLRRLEWKRDLIARVEQRVQAPAVEAPDGAQFDAGVLSRELELAGMAAKQLACSAYAAVAEESLQLHGGIGMTAEHDCHLYLKRALLNEHLGRAPDAAQQALAESVLRV